ncbi:MAG: hypothetical protein ACFHHU_00265 [Porticoccaceae bacterium]
MAMSSNSEKVVTDTHQPQGKPDTVITTIIGISAILGLCLSVFFGLNYMSFRDEFYDLKADYEQRGEVINQLATNNILLTERMASVGQPKVKVLNFLEAASKLPGANVDTQEGIEQAFLAMQSVARAYAEDGYLLIDSEAVIASPDAMRLTIEEMRGQ